MSITTSNDETKLPHVNPLSPLDGPVIAHRGYHVKEVENTLRAFIEAGRRNYTGIETDIRQTSDGIWVCHHNPTMVSDSTEYGISDLTYEQLANLPLDNSNGIDDAYVPLFDDYLDTCLLYRKRAIIEFKITPTFEVMENVLSHVAEKGLAGHATIISFGLQNIINVKEISAKHGFNFDYEVLLDGVSSVLVPFQNGLNASMYYGIVDQELVKDYESAGLHIAAWTVDEERDARNMLSLGVKVITSNILECTDEYVSNW